MGISWRTDGIWRELEETAIRELYEETGVRCKSLTFVDILSGKKECYKYPNGDEIFGITAIYSTNCTYSWKFSNK